MPALRGSRCPTCNKRFSRSGDMKRHEQTHVPHWKRPFGCTRCNKRFVQRSALNTHMNVHTGETPYMCPIAGCNRAFNDPSSRSRHKREAHGKQPGYKCPVDGCRSRIKRRSAFVKHLENKHGMWPSMGEVDDMLVGAVTSNADVKVEEASDDEDYFPPPPRIYRRRAAVVSRSPSPEPSALLNVPLITFTPSRTSSPVNPDYFVGSPTPELSSSGSSGTSSRSSSILCSPAILSGNLDSHLAYSYAAVSDSSFEFDGLIHDPMPPQADQVKGVDADSIYNADYDPSPAMVWDNSVPYFSGADDHYALSTDMSPLSELDLTPLDTTLEGEPIQESATLQGLYYDTIPHSFAAWSQS